MGHPDRSIFLVEDLVDHIYKENQNTSLHRIPLHSTSLLRMTAPLVFWALALLGTKFHSKLNQKLGQFSRKLVAHPDIQFDNFLMCYHFCKLKYNKLVFDYQDDLVQKKVPQYPNNLSTTSTRIENLIIKLILIDGIFY